MTALPLRADASVGSPTTAVRRGYGRVMRTELVILSFLWWSNTKVLANLFCQESIDLAVAWYG